MKFRASCVSLAICLFALTSAQDPSAKVTYSTVAAPADRVLQEISKLSGANLKASPQTAHEILVLNVKDVPLADLMKRIAAVTSGEWPEKSGVTWLVPANMIRQQQEREEQA